MTVEDAKSKKKKRFALTEKMRWLTFLEKVSEKFDYRDLHKLEDEQERMW